MPDIVFKTDEYIFDVRAVGVLVKNKKLLVQREKDGNEYALPGGHVKFGETTADALRREYMEETGAAICCRRLLWTEECFWEWNGKKAHNLSYYYLIELASGEDIPDKSVDVPHKDNNNVLISWMPIDKLKDIVIYPAFLKKILEMEGPVEHFISR